MHLLSNNIFSFNYTIDTDYLFLHKSYSNYQQNMYFVITELKGLYEKYTFWKSK